MKKIVSLIILVGAFSSPLLAGDRQDEVSQALAELGQDKTDRAGGDGALDNEHTAANKLIESLDEQIALQEEKDARKKLEQALVSTADESLQKAFDALDLNCLNQRQVKNAFHTWQEATAAAKKEKEQSSSGPAPTSLGVVVAKSNQSKPEVMKFVLNYLACLYGQQADTKAFIDSAGFSAQHCADAAFYLIDWNAIESLYLSSGAGCVEEDYGLGNTDITSFGDTKGTLVCKSFGPERYDSDQAALREKIFQNLFNQAQQLFRCLDTGKRIKIVLPNGAVWSVFKDTQTGKYFLTQIGLRSDDVSTQVIEVGLPVGQVSTLSCYLAKDPLTFLREAEAVRLHEVLDKLSVQYSYCSMAATAVAVFFVMVIIAQLAGVEFDWENIDFSKMDIAKFPDDMPR